MAADRAHTLKVYNWADYIDETVLDDFKVWYKEQTGEEVEVIYQLFDINEIMLAKIEKGKEDPADEGIYTKDHGELDDAPVGSDGFPREGAVAAMINVQAGVDEADPHEEDQQGQNDAVDQIDLLFEFL